ncbi:hypothetical protein N480_13645 [Pseudoalteromonas luteoviolacea S2607]|uniref:hypothetical protein n=1 Tax=Pseudoalteromonas luteoviolacea TaxID=43657 RepID=UPI0007B07651|nr:hypothetical protein [Pseudoalteromonas luteoviolacea]KZN38693.1 hypothetical protein N480_13645 [Pseudoalteromonas luteoviolacea S2607]
MINSLLKKLLVLIASILTCQYSMADTDVHQKITPLISDELKLKIIETLADGDEYVFSLQYAKNITIEGSGAVLEAKFMNVALWHKNQLLISTPSIPFLIDENLLFSTLRVNKEKIGNIQLEFGYGNKSSPIPSKVFSIKLDSSVLKQNLKAP